jgi:predicted amidohydrolase
VSTLTVALLQTDRPDPEAALAAGVAACRRAAAMGADVALFPEMFSNGYASTVPEELETANVYRHPRRWRADGAPAVPLPERPAAAWRGEPVAADGPFVTRFRDLAAELGMAIALTYLEAWQPDGAVRNTVTLIDRHGEPVLTQAKVHTCAFGWQETLLTPGEAFTTAELDTASAGPVRVGAMICYDREFPESARALALAGAELILVPNACDMNANRLTQLRSRAYENMTAVAMANYAGPGWGHSVAYDGMAFGPDGSRDTLVVEAGEAPGVYPAVFDLAALREYREAETWGDAFRRPSAYGPLTRREVAAPFVRVTPDGTAPPR